MHQQSIITKILVITRAIFLLVLVGGIVSLMVHFTNLNAKKQSITSQAEETDLTKNNQVLVLNNGFVTIPSSDSLSPKRGFTVEARIKPQSNSGGTIISNSSLSEFSYILFVRVYPYQNEAGANLLTEYYFRVFDKTKSCAPQTAHQSLIVNANTYQQWKHIAGVIDTEGKVYIFVNGQPSINTAGSIETPVISEPCTNKNPITIGARLFEQGKADDYFTGQMDEVRISSIARYTNYFSPPTSSFQTDDSTILLYHVNGSLKDESPNRFDGSVIGGQFIPGNAYIPK